MKNDTINYQNPLKTQQNKQVSQVNFTSPLCINYSETEDAQMGFYSEKTPSPGELLGTPGVSHLHLPSSTAHSPGTLLLLATPAGWGRGKSNAAATESGRGSPASACSHA